MTVDLAGLLPSWELHLRAERKRPETVKSYGDGVRCFLAWADDDGRPAVLDRASVNAFTADLPEAGAEPTTARGRQLALRRFSAWLLEEGESDADHLIGLEAPKLDAKVVEPLTAEPIKALIAACTGRDLRDRRDEALVRLMIETGARAGEVVALDTEDVDLSTGTATVRRGKGGQGRVVPFGPQTSRALDRYLRARRSHRLADTPALWLGDRGKAFSYDALHRTLGERARAAGIEGFRPHQLRHTAGSPPAAARVASWPWPASRQRASVTSTSTRPCMGMMRRPARTAAVTPRRLDGKGRTSRTRARAGPLMGRPCPALVYSRVGRGAARSTATPAPGTRRRARACCGPSGPSRARTWCCSPARPRGLEHAGFPAGPATGRRGRHHGRRAARQSAAVASTRAVGVIDVDARRTFSADQVIAAFDQRPTPRGLAVSGASGVGGESSAYVTSPLDTVAEPS